MKIAFFHEVSQGGARRAVFEFAKVLKKRHVVDLYYTDEKEENTAKDIFVGTYFYKFIPKQWIGKDWKRKLYKDTIELIALFLLHRKIANVINKKSYDVVFLSPSKFTQAPFLLRFLSTRKVYYCQEPLRIVYEKALAVPTSWPLSRRIYEGVNRYMRKWIDRSNLGFSDTILANSKFSKGNIARAYKRDSAVCYMGVNPKSFVPSRREKKYDVLYVGALDKTDGYDLLLEAIDKMKKKPLVKSLLRERVWIDNDKQMARLYQNAKVIVCLAKNEPFGLIPLEAMSCGIPIIAVNEAGYKETVRHKKTGILIRRNPEALARALSNVLQSKDVREKMGNLARKDMVENWSWKKREKALEGIFKHGTEKS
ncbi:MAG: glycosyltransferase family 4 protein [bacterium]|nr:glycosyltransferase family 4 protein [bacterium]